jgi:hypothetical protein
LGSSLGVSRVDSSEASNAFFLVGHGSNFIRY